MPLWVVVLVYMTGVALIVLEALIPGMMARSSALA